MKTKGTSFTFHKELVQTYVQILGDTNPLYESVESAQKFGLQTIPIPPAMPMTVYQSFEIPWRMKPPVIHRKQQCINHRQMFIDETYTGFISLTDVIVRKEYTFSKQTLFLYDTTGNLCFSGISHIVSGELL